MVATDSSMLIALLRLEPGAAAARRILREHRGECFAHAVNLGEVYTNFARYADEATASRAVDIVRAAGVITRTDLDDAFWQDAAGLVALARRAGRGLALGDAYGIALARRLGCAFVTAEHGEMEFVAAQGLVQVRYIR